MLPAFVARNLWRTWPTVEAIVVPPERRALVVVSELTRRWMERALLPARVVLHVLRECAARARRIAWPSTRRQAGGTGVACGPRKR